MKTENKTGAAKTAPKVDNTSAARQARRNGPLNEKARAKGWSGISEYLTAIIKDEIELPQKPE